MDFNTPSKSFGRGGGDGWGGGSGGDRGGPDVWEWVSGGLENRRGKILRLQVGRENRKNLVWPVRNPSILHSHTHLHT